MITKDTKICIVGLGLLGGSYAQKLSLLGYHVNAIDTNLESIEYALEKQYIQKGSNDPSLVKDADLVIFGLYPMALVNWLKENQHLLKKGCICTDVTGIKQMIMAKIKPFLRLDINFIFAHPMCGKEVSGIKNSDAKMFLDANFIIIKDDNIEAMETIEQLARILGFARISYLDAKKHDEMIAFLSQLTHVIAVCLMNCKEDNDLKKYTGDSFRDLTRIAKINENLWYELFIENKDLLLAQMDEFILSLKEFRSALLNEDEVKIKSLFRQATKRRGEFDKSEDISN